MQVSTKLILASASPRRRDLLEQLNLTFTVQVSSADEIIPEGESPDEVVQILARRKSTPVAAEYPTALTLGADTIVVHEGDILGKPRTKDEARHMLSRLRSSTHTVYTGISLVHATSSRDVTAFEATHVKFGKISDAEIDAYVASGSPMDKAGAYGIQDEMGPLFVERIDGDYYAVVGLPLRRLYVTLRTEFSDLLLL
jgi:septum formation protein